MGKEKWKHIPCSIEQDLQPWPCGTQKVLKDLTACVFPFLHSPTHLPHSQNQQISHELPATHYTVNFHKIQTTLLSPSFLVQYYPSEKIYIYKGERFLNPKIISRREDWDERCLWYGVSGLPLVLIKDVRK